MRLELKYQVMFKKNTIKSLCLLAAFVFAGFGANAQLTHLEQSFYLNGNLPLSDFASDNLLVPMTQDFMGSDAIVGMGLGYRVSYRFDIGVGEVSPFIHADFQWNTISSEHRDNYTLNDCSKPNYINIPIFAGVNYRYQITDILTPFVEFGLGVDILKITKEGGGSGLPKMKYKTSGAFAWQVGGGTFLGSHVSVGIHYNGYGKHTIKYKSSTVSDLTGTVYEPNASVQPSQLRRIGLFTLRIGFHF